MDKDDIKLLRRFLINGKADKVLEALMKFFEAKDAAELNNVILLYAEYNNMQEKSSLGLGEFNEIRNRINLAVLAILSTIEKNRTTEPPETPKTIDVDLPLEGRLKGVEDKVELILSIVEKINESPLNKFVRSNVFNLLHTKTKDQLISLAEVASDSYDYNFLIKACYDVLETEFLTAIFIPLKEEIKITEFSKEEIYAKLEGDQKMQFYEYLLNKREVLSVRQMANLLSSNVNIKINTKSKEYNFIFYFLLRNYIIIDRRKLETDLVDLVKERQDKKLDSYIFSKSDYEEVRDVMIEILSNLQSKNGE